MISSLVHCSAHHPVGGACSPEWSSACTKWPVAMAATAQQSWSPLRTGSVILGRVMWKSMWTPSPPLDWVRLQQSTVLLSVLFMIQSNPDVHSHVLFFIACPWMFSFNQKYDTIYFHFIFWMHHRSYVILLDIAWIRAEDELEDELYDITISRLQDISVKNIITKMKII